MSQENVEFNPKKIKNEHGHIFIEYLDYFI